MALAPAQAVFFWRRFCKPVPMFVRLHENFFSTPLSTLLLRAILVPAILLAAGVSPAAENPPRTRAERAEVMNLAVPRLREGDIIFICYTHVLYRRIAETSRSWESHVGILLRDRRGEWQVAESTLPFTKFTSLEKFFLHSKDGRFMIRRLREGLSQEQIQRLRGAVGSRMGKLYDLGFKYDSPRLYCSKFVYDSFLEATGHRIGRIETFREMFAGNPTAPLSFWRVWFWGSIPWERRTVTTTSQLQSPALVTMFDSEKRVR